MGEASRSAHPVVTMPPTAKKSRTRKKRRRAVTRAAAEVVERAKVIEDLSPAAPGAPEGPTAAAAHSGRASANDGASTLAIDIGGSHVKASVLDG